MFNVHNFLFSGVYSLTTTGKHQYYQGDTTLLFPDNYDAAI